MSDSFGSRWLFGFKIGLMFVTIPSLWVIVADVVTNGRTLASVGVSLPVVLLVYFFAAFAGGIVFALVGPLFRSRLGFGLGGFLITLPLFTAIAATYPGEDLGSLETWRAIVMSAAFVGGLVGFFSWEPSRGRDKWR